jgi:hypothetical protein
MKTMIDRIADAVEEAMPPSELDGTNQHRSFLIGVARAALESMREPTDLMGCGLPEDYKAGSHSATEIWRAMIDAALNEDRWAAKN